MNLLPPNSWSNRNAQKLQEEMPKTPGENQQFVYIGCCIELEGDHITEMNDNSEDASMDDLRENCAGFEQWCEILMVEGTGCLVFGKSRYNGIPCYWADHSRIDFIWVDSECSIINPETDTGRISSKDANISNKPKYNHTAEEMAARNPLTGLPYSNFEKQDEPLIIPIDTKEMARILEEHKPKYSLKEIAAEYGIGAYASKSESDGGEGEPDGSEGK